MDGAPRWIVYAILSALILATLVMLAIFVPELVNR